MDSGDRNPIVVGVKTAAPESPAVRLAGAEALLRGRPLHIVHAFVWPPFTSPDGDGAGYGSPRQDAERIVADAIAEARADRPGLTVSGEVVDGAALETLVNLSARAALLVLGNNTLRRSVTLPVESLAVQASARAGCPVIIADGSERPDAPVVVGVDGSPWMAPALDLAFEEAELRDVPLIVVQAGGNERAAAGVHHPLLHTTLSPWLARHPRVQVEQRVVAEPPTEALGDLSHKAQLLVVGARGWQARLLGSVTQAMLLHADCPVAVGR
ncbi:universal stress protein [Micromonospora pattaloongensis]|uniref:universal stress protein n=1 Tax=Micromonospora pattaloongensis TaxID=405436 RepID=UPI001587DB22|nr:universal stress protein [Micromonospora pattaloongensis]